MTSTPRSLLPRLTATSPAIWGKLPSHGDYVRYNVRYQCDAELKRWIQQEFIPLDNQHRPAVPSSMAHAGLPWCFILPPGYLSFAPKDYVMGVWITSSDKLGRQYPLVMMQTASRQWIKQHFAPHIHEPNNWLFLAARILAKAVYIDKNKPAVSAQDQLIDLTHKIDFVWNLCKPSWRSFGKRHYQRMSFTEINDMIGLPHPDDFIHQLDGVRYLPWSDWTERLLGDIPQPLFWQQDLSGRFVAASSNMHHISFLDA